MRSRTTSPIRKLFALFMLVLSPWLALSAQEMIGGKQVRTGIWEGRQIEYLKGEIAIILEPDASQADVFPLLQSHGATIKRDFDKLGWGLIELPENVDVLSLAAELKRNPMIEAAEPNMVIRAHFDPNDPYYQDGHQWALKNTGQSPPGGTSDADIDAPEAWEITRGSSSIIIAILDSGIPMVGGSLSHSDLNDASKFILGPDYIDIPADGVKDGLGHGTHVTGIAAAETDNTTGIAGACGNCRVMVIQVFNAYGSGTWGAFYNGVVYAVDNGAEVINFSGGGSSPSSTAEQGVQYAYNNGVPIVVSSGNNNGSVLWPAAYSTSYSNVIAVGATEYDDLRASYSNYGSQLNVVAPGGAHDAGYPVDAGDIYSTMPNYSVTLNGSPYYVSQNYGYLPGTSMAAPHVSGLAGLLLSLDSSLEPWQLRKTIELSADDKGTPERDDYYGWGRINANRAVRTLYVPQVYATIQSALNVAISGQEVVVSVGTHSITSSTTVPSGVTLTIASGSTVNFSSGAILTSYGDLTINDNATLNLADIVVKSGGSMTVKPGVTFNMSIYDEILSFGLLQVQGGSNKVRFQSTGGITWDGITLSGTGTGLSYIQNAEVSGSVWGITVIGVDYLFMRNVTASGNGYRGLNIYWTDYYSSITVDQSRFRDTDDGEGAIIDFAFVDFGWYNIFTNNSKAGIYINNLGYVQFGEVEDEAEAWITSNSRGIHLNTFSYANIGEDATDFGGYNQIYGNSLYDVEVEYGSELKAELTWWGSNPPNTSKFSVSGGSVFDYTPYLTSPPLPKAIVTTTITPARFLRVIRELARSDSISGPIRAQAAVATARNHADPSIAQLASLLHIRTLIQRGNALEGITLAEQLLTEPGFSDDYRRIAAKQLFYAYLQQLGDLPRAEDMYSLLAQLKDEDIANGWLAHTFERYAGRAPAAQAPQLTEIEKEKVLGLASYPNPFNPSTTLSYDLPKDARVRLVIYDVLGREVARLVDKRLEAGYHSVIWNGRGVPTGLYIARLFIPPTATKSIKLVMMK